MDEDIRVFCSSNSDTFIHTKLRGDTAVGLEEEIWEDSEVDKKDGSEDGLIFGLEGEI